VGTTASTQLVDGSVNLDVRAAPFRGSPSALLTRVNKINADLNHARGSDSAMTDRYAVTTDQGVDGVAEDFVGGEKQGSIVAFVFPGGEGVEVVVSGPRGAISRRRDDIVAMIRSLRAAS